MSQPPPDPAPVRMLSIDALRGFDMFWIMGADGLVAALDQLSDWRPVATAAEQLRHAEWHGFTFYDLIFPLFIYVVGVSIVLALASRRDEPGGRGSLYKRILRRALLLYILGVFFYGGLSNPWNEIRWVGVLQRIAICYLCGAIVFLNLRPRGQAALLAALLLGYWGLMELIPVPDFATGDYSPQGNLAGHIDRVLLPGRAWFREWGWDPEGILSTIPSVGTCLIGLLSGELLRSERVAPQRKVFVLLGAGAAALAVGYLWGTWMPINKKIWTSSYALVAGGYSCLLFGCFYQVIDIWQWRRWCLPFVIIGANAIFIYIAAEVVPFDQIALRFVGGDVAKWLGPWSGVVTIAVQLALEFAILWWMYTKRIFIRI